MKYHFKVHCEDGGYWAECLELEGCQTQADDLVELQANMEEVLNLYLCEPEDSKTIFALPKKVKSDTKIVEVEVNPCVAFAVLLRMTRLKRNLSMREMAKQLHYKNLNSYVKLEKPQTANPELKTLAKIKRAFKEFPIELVLS
tara:strand:- start:22045 stop:22473 length:429 start_codon:yes stop_codon:yes gene_type:complete